MVSQLTVIDAAFLSRSWVGVTRKMHEEKTEKVRGGRENKTRGETDAVLAVSLILSAADCSAALSNLSLIPVLLTNCRVLFEIWANVLCGQAKREKENSLYVNMSRWLKPGFPVSEVAQNNPLKLQERRKD